MLKEVHAVLPAADIHRARSFYHDTLGLDPDEEYPGSLVYHPVEGSAFEIYETDAVMAGTSQMGWLTDDLDSEMEQLRARGIVFEKLGAPGVKMVAGVGAMPDAKAAWFRDTEGNLICITQLTRGPKEGQSGLGSSSSDLPDSKWITGLPKDLVTGVPAV